MAIPVYLQGSQTGNLLYPPQTAGNYIPGNGMPPYGLPTSGNSYIQPAPMQGPTGGSLPAGNSFGDHNINASQLTLAQQIMSSPSASAENKFWAENLLKNQGGSLANNDLTVIGQPTAADAAWAAQVEADRQRGLNPTASSGGGGFGGAVNTTKPPSSGSGLLSPGNSPAPDSSPSFSGGPVSLPSGVIPFKPPDGGTYYPPGGGQPPSGGGAALSMQPANPQNALDAYKNTPGYQLLNTPGAYEQSPGYQFAVNDALQQVQKQASARGLLESGAALRGMTDRAQGMAMQDYGNWWNRQNQQFDNYQNRLAGLAGGNVGGDQAFNLGQSLGAGSMQTGSNMVGLFGNQGAAGYGGLVNTGAAQSNNMTNAGTQQAQIGAANQSTQLAGAVYNRGLF